ncbi:hypothetical protein EUX98_g9205, partial [Antrodiella citrinella]
MHPHLDPSSLLYTCVNHHAQYNLAVESNAPLLTSYIAHSAPPIDETERRFMREYERAMDLQNACVGSEDPTEPDQDLDQDVFLPPLTISEDGPPPLMDDDEDDDDDDDMHPSFFPDDSGDLSAAALEHIASIPLADDPTQSMPLFYDDDDDALGDISDSDPFHKPLETS